MSAHITKDMKIKKTLTQIISAAALTACLTGCSDNDAVKKIAKQYPGCNTEQTHLETCEIPFSNFNYKPGQYILVSQCEDEKMTIYTKEGELIGKLIPEETAPGILPSRYRTTPSKFMVNNEIQMCTEIVKKESDYKKCLKPVPGSRDCKPDYSVRS